MDTCTLVPAVLEPAALDRFGDEIAELSAHLGHTATPGWLGEPLDVGYAIDVLHPLAR